MKKTVIASIGLILLAPAICFADDGQDAVDLLTYSLKCANKAISEHGNGDDHFSHTINKYTGSKSQLRIETESKLDGSPEIIRETITANFAALEKADYFNSPFEVFIDGAPVRNVEFFCSKNVDCIQSKGNSGAASSDRDHTISVCDAETAAHVKLAIETLIRLNK
jgi:hypothetical protein